MNDHIDTQLEEATARAATFDDKRRAYVERVVRHRCGDILTGAEIGGTAADLPSKGDHDLSSAAPVMMIPRELAERVEAALEAITDRMDRIERWLHVEGAA
jgi:hypothetical protein